MNRLRASAASIALAALPLSFSSLVAQESQDNDERSVPAAPGSEPANWTAYADDDTSLLTQASAVFADLRAKHGVEAEPVIVAKNVDLVAMNDRPGRPIREGNGSEGCKFMESPGSRIREWRCYYPNDGEKALNEYQFSEEIRINRRLSEAAFLIETEIANQQRGN